MNLPGMVTINITAAATPGQLLARFRFQGADGSVYDSAEPMLLSPGTTMSYGPVYAEISLDSSWAVVPTEAHVPGDKPTLAAAPKPGTPATSPRR